MIQIEWQSLSQILVKRSPITAPTQPSKGRHFCNNGFFFEKSTTSSVVFIAARISYIRFFTAVHIYDFHISTVIIHHLDGLFGPNLMTSSWLVSSLGGALHRYRRGHGFKSRTGLNFFSGLISTTSSVVFMAARISYIHENFCCRGKRNTRPTTNVTTS